MKQYIFAAMLALGGAAPLHASQIRTATFCNLPSDEIPQSLLESILAEAQPDLPALEGLSMSEMLEMYYDAEIIVSRQGRDPQNPAYSLFKVQAGGGSVIIAILEGL